MNDTTKRDSSQASRVWESIGKSDEWYTPKYIFDALQTGFDMDVAAASQGKSHVPASHSIIWPRDGLSELWQGFIWMNPPFGGRDGLAPWLDKFFDHGNGIALTPDRTSASWWQVAMRKADAVLLCDGRVKFLRPDGTEGKSPSTGTALFAAGDRAVMCLRRAQESGLGVVLVKS